MSEYEDIMQGLSEALAYVKGEKANVRVMTVTTKKRASVHPKQKPDTSYHAGHGKTESTPHAPHAK